MSLKRVVNVGDKFGKLEIIKESKSKFGRRCFVVKCACGKIKKTLLSDLVTGHATSCGCWRRDHKLKHGHASINVNYRTPEYRTWLGIKSRCFNKNNTRYADYGGRGITVYSKWINNFTEFLKYVGFRPSKNHSIDRINNDGNYEPGNIRWATRKEQLVNRRKYAKKFSKTIST